jgi:hypothetical protein
MKTLKILGCIALIAAAVVYAAKTPTVFGPGVEGFLKYPKSVTPVPTYTNLNGWVIFQGTDAKTQIQFTKLEAANLLIYGTMKGISYKAAVKGTIGQASNVLFGTSTSTPDQNYTPGGNAKLNVKLKGVNVGTVAATDVNQVQVQNLFGGFAGKRTLNGKEKGAKFTAFGGIYGVDGTDRVYFGKAGWPATIVNGVTAKDKTIGRIQWVNAALCGVPTGKEGKIKWTAKVLNTAGADILVATPNPFSTKSKNVTFTAAP